MAPDGGGLVMDRGDGGLERERAGGAGRECLLDEGGPPRDQVAVPPGAVLLGERHQVAAVVGARGRPRVGEQHEGEQTRRLGVVGQRAVQPLRDPDRLDGQVGVDEVRAAGRRVPLVEGEVQDVPHRVQPPREIRRGRCLEAGPGPAQGGLRAADPLRHGGLGDQEPRGDLRRGQSGDRPQGQGDLRALAQRGVGTEQQHLHRVVIVAGVRRRPVRGPRGPRRTPRPRARAGCGPSGCAGGR